MDQDDAPPPLRMLTEPSCGEVVAYSFLVDSAIEGLFTSRN